MIISKKSWHYRILNFLGWTKKSWMGRESLCPYFWKLIAALTLLVGVVPFVATGMGINVYSMFSPAINEMYDEANMAIATAVAEAEEAGKSEADIKKIKQELSISPSQAVKMHWNVENTFLRVVISLSMVFGFIAWLAAAGALIVATFFGVKIGCEALNQKTRIGAAIGSGVSTVVGKPARATGSVFSGWWKAHKEKHCPFIDFVDE